MKNVVTICLVGLASLIISCEHDVVLPTAGFEPEFYIDYSIHTTKLQNIPKFATFEKIKFVDHSTDGVTYSWDFGNGQTSIEKEPVMQYEAGGEYPVTLTVESETGNKAAYTESIRIYERYVDKISINLMGWDFNLTNQDDLGWEEDAVLDVILEIGVLNETDFLTPSTILYTADTIRSLTPGGPLVTINLEEDFKIDYNLLSILERPRPAYVIQLSAIHNGERRLFYSSEYFPGLTRYLDFETGLFKMKSGETIYVDCHFE